jgi:uncharacterized repeat protein (TIGR01451 family)
VKRTIRAFVFLLACVTGSVAHAVMTTQNICSGGADATQLATALGGQGVTISNVTVKGHCEALGLFAGGPACLGFPQGSGVVLSSGTVQSAVGPNTDNASEVLPDPPGADDGDADLSEIIDGDTNDAAVLEFDVVPQGDTIAFRYVFGSDEYNEFVYEFNDVFALFVNGVNYALVPGTQTAVSIDTVNAGNNGIPAANPQYYVNNDWELNPPQNGTCTEVEADGFTVLLTLAAPVVPNQPNHVKLAVADAEDVAVNSWVFVEAGSIQVPYDLSISKSGPEGPVPVGTEAEWTLNYRNNETQVAENVVITDTLPANTRFVRSDPAICTAAAKTVTCPIGTLDGEEGDETLRIITISSVAGAFTNIATITGDASRNDKNPLDNTASATIEVICVDGIPCDDQNGCTQTDVCQGDVCVGGNPKQCTALDVCHVAGVCQPSTGLCTNPPGNDGAGCGDSNVCNGDEVCQSGLCVAPNTSAAIACIAESFRGFVSNFQSNTVSILDPGSATIAGEIPVPNGPWGVAIHPAGTEVWVTQRNGRAVAVLDPNARTVLATIPVGGTPLGVAIHPNGLRAYVANYDDDRVTVIDTVSRTVVGSIPVAAGPSAFAFNAAATRLYVSGFAANAVSVVDTASNDVIANVPTGVQPLGMALDRSRGRLFVANYEGASVTVIGAVSHTVLGTIPVGQRPFGVATDPARSRVYVTNASSDSISVINAGSVGIEHTIAEVGRAPLSIGLDLTGTRAFVANAGEATLAVVDTSAFAVTSKIPAGQQPIAFGSFLGATASSCPLPAPVCTDGDPTTSETCSAVDGCQYAVLGAGGTLAATLQSLVQTINGAGGDLGNARKALQQQLNNAASQITPGIGALVADRIHTNARPPAATRKRLKRIDRALAKFIRALQKGLRKKAVQRDVGLRLLDLARAAQAATQSALGGKAVVAPKNGLLTPLPLSASRAGRPRPPLP